MGADAFMDDLDRFLRSPEGKAHLAELRGTLVGRTVRDVVFSREAWYIAATLHLDDGGSFFATQPWLDKDAIAEDFAEVLEREYYLDYPERRAAHAAARQRGKRRRKRRRKRGG